MTTTLPATVMSLQAAFKLLEDIGFSVKIDHKGNSIFGTIEPEPHKIEEGEFKPSFRSVFVGSTSNGEYYVTSHIHGKFRRKRCRIWHDCDFLNIFAYAKTPKEAVERWLLNWGNLQYNLPYKISK